MKVQLIGDNVSGVSEIRQFLERACEVTSELLCTATTVSQGTDAIVVMVDLTRSANIITLKDLAKKLALVPKRLFLLEKPSRLLVVQSYALGATAVLEMPVARFEIFAKLFDRPPAITTLPRKATEGEITAQAAAKYVRSMFGAAIRGDQVDVGEATKAGNSIVARIAEDGLSAWLDSVRTHHEGTYQHCLLVTGVTADFGLKLGLCKRDLERLITAAMLHDVGKAVIPVSILEKPGRLNEEERDIIETHSAAGFDALKDNPAVSAEILDVVRHHHEALDGSGYPDKLSGASITDLTRILSIADVFSALIERRSYKEALARDKAFAILQSMTGKLEMPLVAAFEAVALTR